MGNENWVVTKSLFHKSKTIQSSLQRNCAHYVFTVTPLKIMLLTTVAIFVTNVEVSLYVTAGKL